jgi:5'-3' exonuclease
MLTHEDQPTGVIYGVLEQIRHLCFNQRVRSSRLMVFADSRESARRELYPQYKEKRAVNPEQEARHEVCRQVRKLAVEILPQLGIRVEQQPGLESDDLMAYAAKAITETGQRGIMITADNDLYQCITPCVAWFDPSRDRFMTDVDFLAEYGVRPADWGAVKVLAGCPGDNVQGIPGIGEVTALKFVRRHEITNSRRHAIEMHLSNAKWMAMAELLVRLPHPLTKPFLLRPPKWNREAWGRLCAQYGFESYADTQARGIQWRQIMEDRVCAEDRQSRCRRRGDR